MSPSGFGMVSLPPLVLMLCIVLVCYGCINQTDFSELEIESVDPHLAIPILHGFVTTNELVEQLQDNATVTINDNGVYAVQFFADPFVQRKDDIFPKVLFGLPVPILDSVVSLPLSAFQEATLTRATLKGDQIFFIFNSDLEEDISIMVEIPNLKREGEVFSFEYDLPFDGTSPSTLTTPMIDLAGYEMESIDGLVQLVYDARKKDGTRIVLPPSFARVNAFDFSYIEGQIGQSVIPTEVQSIDITIEDSLVEGTYKFQDPKIHFDITNSFGVPIGVKVKELYLVDGADRARQIESPLFDDIIILSFPSLDMVGQSVVDRITFDKSNSNILDLLEDDIQEIRYDLDIITNPAMDENEFFLTDSSKAIIDATLDLSFIATVEKVTAQHVAPVFLADIDTLSTSRIKIFVNSGIPLSFSPELVFFSLADQQLPLIADVEPNIISAKTDLLGNVVGNSESVIYYTLSTDQITLLATMDSVRATLSVQSPQNGSDPSIIRPGQVLEYGIGMEARVNR